MAAATLTGSRALVTGGSSGIGSSVAEALAARGVRVVVTGRDAARLAAVADRIGGDSVVADLSEADASQLLADAVRPGGLDVLVHCAGVGLVAAAEQLTDDRVHAVVAVNLLAPIALTRELLPELRASGRGRLAFVGSIAGRLGVPLESAYAASKAGLAAYADSLRGELADSGVAVTTLTPGVVDTEFFHRRGVPYPRRFPRPLPADRVASAFVRAIDEGRSEAVVPRWLRLPIVVHDLAPSAYHLLSSRWGRQVSSTR